MGLDASKARFSLLDRLTEERGKLLATCDLATLDAQGEKYEAARARRDTDDDGVAGLRARLERAASASLDVLRRAAVPLVALALAVTGPALAEDPPAWGEKDSTAVCTAKEKRAVCPDGFVAPKCQPVPGGCRCTCVHPGTGLPLPARLPGEGGR